MYRSNSQPAQHLTQYKRLLQGNQRIQEEHNSLYFNFHLAVCKYFWPKLVIMNVPRNSWLETNVRFAINVLLSVIESGCQNRQCSERQGETGRVDYLSFFNYLNLFCFSLILFHCTFSISYKILQYFGYYYYILIWMWLAIGPFFLCAHFSSFHAHASLLTFFVCFFILFLSCCSHAQVFGKTLVHEFPISYRETEWYLLFLTVQLQELNVHSELKTRNSCALANLCL